MTGAQESAGRARDDAGASPGPPGGTGRSRRDPARIVGGVLAGVGVLALVAVPAAQAAFLAVAGFTGCFLECGEPAVGAGVLWLSLALGLIGSPVIVGALVARVPLRRLWPWLLALGIVVVVGMQLLQRVA